MMMVCGINLTFSGAQSSGSRDHGEGGAAVHCSQVVLHVGTDVRMWRAERWLTCPGRRVRWQTDQGYIWDDWAARKSWRSVERELQTETSDTKTKAEN